MAKSKMSTLKKLSSAGTSLMCAIAWMVALLAIVDSSASQQREQQRLSKLDTALVSPTAIEFVETPLTDIADYLKDLTGVPVVLDRRGLAQARLDGQVPITFRNTSDAPLYVVLDRMLRPLGLGWVAEGEAIMLTTDEVASSRYTTRTYYVGDLAWWAGTQQLARIVVTTIEPSSWSNVGGKGSIRAAGTQIVVTQNQAAHRKIVQLLHDARRRRSD